MGSALVGAGGWGYFAGGLATYARAFRFVEINASFYRRIPEQQARGWRSQVPPEFTFSVKAYRDVTHRDRLRATAPARAAFAHDVRIARILDAPYIVLETPPDLAFDDAQVEGVREMASIVGGSTRLGLEARAYRGTRLPAPLKTAMEDLHVLDVVDLSQTRPRVAADAVYTRLFGPGPQNLYQFDDVELAEIDRAGHDAMRAAFTFHGVRMYTDAARFLAFKRTGLFPGATSSQGLASLDEVLRPDARFPASKDELVRGHGWKVIDTSEGSHIHAFLILSALPDRTFGSLDEMMSELDRAAPA